MKNYLVLFSNTIHLELFVDYVTHGLSLTPIISLSLDLLHVSIWAFDKLTMHTNILIPLTLNFYITWCKFLKNILISCKTVFSHLKNKSFMLIWDIVDTLTNSPTQTLLLDISPLPFLLHVRDISTCSKTCEFVCSNQNHAHSTYLGNSLSYFTHSPTSLQQSLPFVPSHTTTLNLITYHYWNKIQILSLTSTTYTPQQVSLPANPPPSPQIHVTTWSQSNIFFQEIILLPCPISY